MCDEKKGICQMFLHFKEKDKVGLGFELLELLKYLYFGWEGSLG